MKLLALSTVRTGNELPDPIIACFEAELSSFGFFQRPVSICTSSFNYYFLLLSCIPTFLYAVSIFICHQSDEKRSWSQETHHGFWDPIVAQMVE